MATAAQFRTEEIAKAPRGWKVRTVKRGEHELRIGFPPGPRKKGSGKVLEILHPKKEKNPSCIVSTQAKKNPGELLIFSNPATRTKQKAKRARSGKKRNPENLDQAVHLYESFHGKDPKQIVELHVSSAVRKDYTSLGDLVAIGLDDGGFTASQLVNRWEDCAHLAFENTKLTSAPNGRQLYCMGGRINLTSMLKNFDGVDPSKDFIDLGEAFFVVYEARKAQTKFEPIEWVHKFGEKGGARPSLMYDRLRQGIYFVGGDYFIDSSNGPSPGIEN
jgi:hypothetical protein